MSTGRETEKPSASADMEEIDNGPLFVVVQRSPELKQGKFVGVINDLTAIWGGPAWLDFIRDRKNRT